MSRHRQLLRAQRTWDALGQRDALRAVLTTDETEGHGWDLEAFLRTGVDEVTEVMAYLQQRQPSLGRHRALDFGCGVGRIAQALAAHFEQVVGVDIAPAMLARAELLNRYPDRCDYHLNTTTDLRAIGDGTADLVYSNLVLQHLPATLVAGYIAEFARVLAPGGAALFQLPSDRRQPHAGWLATLRRATGRRLASLRDRCAIEMYGVPRPQVEAWIKTAGLQLDHVFEDHRAGPDWISLRYYATRPTRLTTAASPSSPG